MNLQEANSLATSAYQGRQHKSGEPYLNHVRSVARILGNFSVEIQVSALLSGIFSVTRLTHRNLRRMGASFEIVETVQALTAFPGMTAADLMQRIAEEGRSATLIKIADSAHGARRAREMKPTGVVRRSLEEECDLASRVLWPQVPQGDLRSVLKKADPCLIEKVNELERRLGQAKEVDLEGMALRWISGMPMVDIAVEMELPPGSISNHIKRARSKFPDLPWEERKSARRSTAGVNSYIKMNDGRPGESRLVQGSVIRGVSRTRNF